MRLLALLLVLGICSCEIKVGTRNSDEPGNTVASENKSSKIRNGIVLKETGLNVQEAYLTVNGTLMSNENKVDINDVVKIELAIAGWKTENDTVFAGLSERILTSEGDTVINEPDLFLNFVKKINTKEAKKIYLSVQLTGITKIVDYFLVEFRVWDKKTNAEVSGSYKLYLK